jgi:hypothetical protein
MRTETKIKTSLPELSSCAQKWLNRAMSKGRIAWNGDRLGYIAQLIAISLEKENWLGKALDISVFFIKAGRTEDEQSDFVRALGIVHSKGLNGDKQIIANINVLMFHLALEGHIELRYGHKTTLPQRPEAFESYYRRNLVSDGVSYLYMVSSPQRYKFFRSEVPASFRGFLDALGETQRSTRQRSAMNLVEVMAYYNISSLEDVTVDVLCSYFKVNSEAREYYLRNNDKKNKASDLTFNLMLSILDFAYGKSLCKDWEVAKSSGKLNSGTSFKDEPATVSFVKKFTTNGDVSKFTCDSLDHKNFFIETVVRESTVLSFGDFNFTVKDDLSQFRPDNLLEKNHWKTTQLDFINNVKESGTKKNRAIKLTYLNSYLLDYLPTFFAKYPDSGLKYPTNPSEFYGYAFVSHSETLTLALHGAQEHVMFPVTLLDYIYTITEEKAAAQGYIRTNSGRDTVSMIQRYFGFIQSKYTVIPECNIFENPISDFDKDSRAGYGYHKSVKEKIALDYWVLLRMYLLEVSDALLSNAEAVLNKGGRNKQRFNINKKLNWLEHSVEVGTFDASSLGLFSFEEWKGPVKVTSYHGVTSMAALAWSGLRDSNVTWLDLRSYAQYSPIEYDNDDFVTLYINTDKTRTEPYTVEIPGVIMKILDRVAKLRAQVDRTGFDKPIPYKGESSSKWGSVKPLFQSTKGNGTQFGSDFLVELISQFEKCLERHNKKMREVGETPVDFSSSIYLLPQFANPLNFRKTKNYIHAEQDYTASLVRVSDGQSYKFTPIKRAVRWTPHSLRVTFDSVCSVLTDPEIVGKISTGQSAETVGYYAIGTPAEAARIKSIQDASGLEKQFHPDILGKNTRIATISDTLIDEEDYLRRHSLGTAAKDFGCMSLSAIKVDGYKSPIEALVQASANEIAFNRTHICPFNNDCPKEVLAALHGEKNCGLCPYAIINRDHAVGISAELKRLSDIGCDLTRSMKANNLVSSEVENIKNDRNFVIKSVSGWLARHQFLSKNIDSEDYYTGKKNNLVLRHISGSKSGQNLINRLVETDGICTMTTPRLERESARLNRKIMAVMNKNPDGITGLEDFDSESAVALQMIKTICSLNEIKVNQLEAWLESPSPQGVAPKLIEIL